MDKMLKTNFGSIPDEKGHKRRIRIHQGWWRMNVLIEKPGKHPKDPNSDVCNTLIDGRPDHKNFLTTNTKIALERTFEERSEKDGGIMEKERLYNNLLSSQPLCFNFFGELKIDLGFGLKVLQTWWPKITELKKVIFEFAPRERYTNDNSAFDIAFEVAIGNQTGLIGLECKYTDTFSSTEYDKTAYLNIYEKSNSFSAKYEELKVSKFNQLFRNQLIAEALIQNEKYDFVKTGLFCYQNDESAISTTQEFQKMLTNPDSFKLITYNKYIENIQKLELSWSQREWTMLLWARYCGLILSDSLFEKINED